MLRAARLAEDRGVELRVIDMPEGTDPADLVHQDGPAAFTRANGSCRADGRVSGPPGTCRCRPGHAFRQGQSTWGGAQADLSCARTHRNQGRARPRGRGPAGRAYGLRAWNQHRPDTSGIHAYPLLHGSTRFAPSASSSRSVFPAATSAGTISLALKMTTSHRNFIAAPGTTWSSTSTIRSRHCRRTIPRSEHSSTTWHSRRLSVLRRTSGC